MPRTFFETFSTYAANGCHGGEALPGRSRPSPLIGAAGRVPERSAALRGFACQALGPSLSVFVIFSIISSIWARSLMNGGATTPVSPVNFTWQPFQNSLF